MNRQDVDLVRRHPRGVEPGLPVNTLHGLTAREVGQEELLHKI